MNSIKRSATMDMAHVVTGIGAGIGIPCILLLLVDVAVAAPRKAPRPRKAPTPPATAPADAPSHPAPPRDNPPLPTVARGNPTQIEQISSSGAADAATIRPAQITARAIQAKPNETAAVNQLPPGLEGRGGRDAEEASLAPAQTAPEDRLLRDVIQAWHVIRNRGQQPTPELIAREIGPDALTAFLNRYPNGAAMIVSPEPPKPETPVIDPPSPAG